MGRGRSKCPSYHPPTPYTLSPLEKGGEGRGEGGAYTHVPCPFGAPLVTLYHPKSKAFLMCGGGGHARLRGERQLHITPPSYMQKPFARNWYYKRHQCGNKWARSENVNGKGGFPCFPLRCPVSRAWSRAGEYGRSVAKEQIKGYREVRLAGWIVDRGGARELHPY